MKRLLLAIGLLASIGAAGQTVNLLKDINTVTNASGSNPSNFTNVGGVIFFTATDPERGTELWKTNGTGAGTVVVKDINPGSSSSSPSYLTAIGSTVYFAASDGVNGTELWKSDGTDVGTVIVKDINLTGSSSPQYIIAVGSNLYFGADNGSNGREVWKSDGSGANTVMLTEIYSGATGSNPAYLTNANGTIYFRATHPSYGTELWKTTGGAPSLVEDIYAGSTNSSNPYNLTALNSASSSVIMFTAYDATNGYELWVSSGTAATTNLVSIYQVLTGFGCGLAFCPIYDYSGSSSPDYFASTGSYIYFAATSPTTGREVYRHDGTTLTLVEDEVASGDLNPQYLTNVNGTIFFSGSNAGDRELYKATTGAVTLISNINASASSNPSDFEAGSSGTVYFSATHATNGTEFYSSNGTTATWLADINSGTPSSSPTNKAFLGGVVYLSAVNDTYGRELFLYNGSTSLLKDINGGSEDGNPAYILNTGSALYFQATTSSLGTELWKSDGTSVNTFNVADISASTGSSYAFPFGFTNSLIQFQAYTPTKGYEFYVSTGVAGNYTLREINTTDEAGSSPASYGYVTLGNTVYFTAYHPTSGTELWKSTDGAAASLVGGGTGLYSGTGSSYPSDLTVFGSFVYFAATDDADGTELYRTSGSSIQLVSQLNLGSASSYPYDLCVSNSKLFWAADNGSDGYELFYTTSTGATMVKTGGINAGSANANPQLMTDVNGTLFFRAIDGTNGAELWKTDGTSVGTIMVKDINTSAGSDPSSLTAVGTTLYFTATEATYGTELYKSDGTTLGTTMVKDIFSGTSSSTPSRLTNINGTLYFRASNGTGLNLMKTNGTSVGTIVATSTGGAVSYQGVDEIQYLNQNVYWVGTTNTYGKELLYVKAEPLNQPTVLVINGATQSTLNLSWTAATGSPAGYIVARHSGGTPTGLPVDGVAPALNTPLVSGTGTVAYVGTSASFTDTGLSPTTTYYYAVYSYNNGGSSVNIYKPHSPLTGNNFTIAANPTVQASAPFTSNVATTSITFNWTSGNGSERIVLAKQSASAISDVPVDGTAYTANAAMGLGSLIGTSRVVYRGTGTSVNVTQLALGTQYQFIVFELNGTGTQTNYLTSIAGANGSATTTSGLGDQPTSLGFSSIGTNTISLAWTAPTAGSSDNGYIVTRKAGSDPSAPGDVPVNMNAYTAGNTIGTATVVYNTNSNLSNSFTDPINPVTMSPGTVYFYRIYAKTDVTTYVATGPLTGAQTTLATQPTGAPGAISYTPGTTDMTGSFAAGTGATSYIVLQREAGVVAPDAPVDGQNYVVNDVIGSSTVVYVGTLPGPFTSTGLTSNTLYYYAAFSAAGTGAAINYLTSSSSASSRATLGAEPVKQPTNVVFSNLAPTGVDVSFTDAAIVPTGYIVLRSAGAPVADVPVDGVAYVVNNTINAATVVSDGSGTSFSESGLTPGVTYHYAAMSYSGFSDTRNYLVDDAATGSITTPALEPTAQPTSVVFSTRNTTSLSFSFTAAVGTPDGYIVLRSSGAAPTAMPTDGESYSAGGLIGADAIVQVGASTSVFDDNFTDELVEDTHYYYSIFSYNGASGTVNYLTTTPLQGNHFTYADEPTEHPTNVAFSLPTTTSMTVSFDEPASLPAGYLVVRKAVSAPTGVPSDGTAYALGNTVGGDGTVAYIGSTPSFPSTALTASTVYHYAVYPFKGSGVSSNFLSAPTVLIGNRTTLQNEPIAQPTALVFSNISTTSAQLNFTTSDATRYIIIRRDGVAPTETPDDGTVYPDNTTIGSSKVTYTNNAAGFPFTDGTLSTSPMTPGLRYYYAIYGYNATSGVAFLNANYLLTAPLTGFVDIHALAPTAQPTSLNFSVTENSVTGTFTAAAGTPTGYIVIRKAGSAPTGLPQTGTTYSVNAIVGGDGTVVSVGSSTFFTDPGLNPETQYYYSIYSYNGTGGSTSYLTTSPLTNSTTTLDSEPSQPTVFTTVRAVNSIDVSFTLSNAERYLILRKAGSFPTETPTDGTSYTTGTPMSGTTTIVYSGTVSGPVQDTGLSPETVYYYAIFGFNGASGPTFNYNTGSPLTGSASTLSTEPSDAPSNMTFGGITTSSTLLSFTAATSPPTGYLIVRRTGAAPTLVPADGTTYTVGATVSGNKIMQAGTGLSLNESGSLTTETAYYYEVFSYNGSGVTINYLTSQSLSGDMTTLASSPTQPTGFDATNATTSSLQIGFVTSTAAHYLIVRQTGSTPTDLPTDGVGYSVGDDFGSAKVAYAGDTPPVTDTGLSSNTIYYYAIYGYNGLTPAAYNYNTALPLTGSGRTLATQPSASPTGIIFTSTTESSTAVSFTAASGSPSGYLVLRRQGALPNASPVDGTNYSAGAEIGTGNFVVQVDAGLIASDTDLDPETTYYYKVFSYNGTTDSYNYLITSSLSGSVTTLATEPSQPTLFSATNVTGNSATVDITPSDADYYLVLRKAGSAPTETPVDGMEYFTGDPLFTSDIIWAGDMSAFPLDETGLSGDTDYYYVIFGYKGASAVSYNYNTNSPLIGTVSTLASEPSVQPTSLSFDNIDATSATVFFSAVTPGSADGYLVIRRAGQAPSAGPVDGTAYAVGDPIVGSSGTTVESVGAATSINDDNLSAETTYFYQVFSYKGSGSNSNFLTTSPPTNSFTTLATEPSQPTAFTFVGATTSQIEFSFTESGADYYLILRKADTAPIEVPDDRTTYTTGQDLTANTKVIFAGDVTSAFPIQDAGLTAGTHYHYAIFAYNGIDPANYNYSITAPLIGDAFTLVAEPSNQPTGISFASVTSSSAIVSFTAATGSPSGYLVIRKEGSTPNVGPTDGTTYSDDQSLGGGNTVVFIGSALTFSESLTSETAYYYKVYAYNGSGSTINYLTTSPLSGNFTTLDIEPSQPTGFIGTPVTTTSVDINFALSNAEHYLILRKAGTAPTDVPVDGISSYTTDDDLPSGAHVVWAGDAPTLPYNDTNLSAGITYQYVVFGYNGTSTESYNYNTTLPLTGPASTFAAEPTSQPTGLDFTLRTTSGMTVSFTAAADSPVGYLAIRRSIQAPSGTPPADGTAYNVDDNLMNGKVVYVGTATTFPQSTLSAETNYFYQVYSYNGSGNTINYLTSSPLSDSQTTLANEPSQPTVFVASGPGTSSLSISFTQSDAQKYLILRKAGSDPTDIPEDGTGYTVDTDLPEGSRVVRAGAVATLPVPETGLDPETTYHYKIYGFNGASSAAFNYNTTAPLSGVGTTFATEPTGQAGSMSFINLASDGATVSFPAASGSPDGYLVIRKQDSAPSGTPADGTTYAPGDNFATNVVVVAVGPDLEFVEEDLTPEKNYFYRIFSYNGTGQSINYFLTSPRNGSFTTLAIEPSAQPTGPIQFTNKTATGFTVIFNAAVGTPAGYIAIRKDGADPTSAPEDGKTYSASNALPDGTVAFVGSAATFNETIAPAGYHYAIYSFSGTGVSTNYRQTTPLTGTFVTDSTEPIITDNSGTTLNFAAPKTFTFTISDPESQIDNSASKRPQLHYRPLNAQSATFTSVDLQHPSSDTYQIELTANQIGEQGVVYKVTATNIAGLTTTTDLVTLQTLFTSLNSLPQLVGGALQKNYRIISVPLVLTSKAGAAVFAALADKVNGDDWRLFRWLNDTDRYREFTALSEVTVNPGEGYWLISKNTVTIAPGIGHAVDVTTPFEIQVTSGWNQIGNPYLYNVLWSDVNLANSASFKLRTFEGGTSFLDGPVLKTFSGGFVQVPASVTSITIPVEKNPDAGRTMEMRPKTNPLDSDDWEVIVNLMHGDVTNPFGGVGMSSEASAGYDYFDDFSLPRFMNYVELSHPKKIYGMTYTKDIIPLEENHVWEFSIEASDEGITEMSWDNSYFGANDKELVLWDEEEQMAIDMRKERSYSVAHFAERKFKIFYGNHEFIEEQSAANTVLIHTIFPNPATADVSVSFSIPGRDRSNVNVRVVNGMGQQIATVFDGELEAGLHTMQWSGNDYAGLRPANGVYLVEVINGEHRTSKRLVMK